MLTRAARCIVLAAALLSLLAAPASPVGAVTWHNSGNTSFTATAGASTLWGTGANGLFCPAGAITTGTVGTTPFVGPVWTAFTATAKWSGCQLGSTGWTIDCAYTVTASSWQIGTPAVTSGTGDTTCGIYNGSVEVCHVVGNASGHYINPVSPSTFGQTFATTGGGTLTLTDGQGSCPLGSHDRALNSPMTFRITNVSGGTGTLGPIITRTS